MSGIQDAIRRENREGRGALICYLTAGYPDPGSFTEYFQACVGGGADVIEVGVPFSDPVADGPTIQATTLSALRSGVTPRKVFEMTREAKRAAPVPVVLMGYYNPIFRIGEASFARQAAEAGADGLIVADLPFEESEGLRKACESHSLDLVQLVAPTTPDGRMRAICSASRGYVYLVGALGTTGSRESLDSDLPQLIGRAKVACSGKPLAVGFGVSGRQHAEQIVSHGADAVIVGSAILAKILQGAGPESIRDFVGDLKAGCGASPPK